MELTERAVVACILRHGGRICLFKRSAAVGSAQGRWHCISGFLDAGVEPLDQAMVELAEETGLEGDALRLMASPAPIRIPRPSQGWVWVIHAFLFETGTAEMRLDWEHEEYRWIEPTELADSGCVPWVVDVWRALSSD
jgi:ADP-ribose pyrophosphatase YjhB (NUDIX family)